MSTQRQHASILRRESHSARTAAIVIAAVVVVIALAWACVESVLRLLDVEQLLATPRDAYESALTFAEEQPLVLGIGAAVIALLLLGAGMLPGRKPVRVRATERMAVVVDDTVVASAVQAAVTRAAGIGADQARVAVDRRRAHVDLVATTGLTLDTRSAEDAATALLDAASLSPRLRSAIAVRPSRMVQS